MTSLELGSISKTVLPNKVTFKGSWVRISTYVGTHDLTPAKRLPDVHLLFRGLFPFGLDQRAELV